MFFMDRCACPGWPVQVPVAVLAPASPYNNALRARPQFRAGGPRPVRGPDAPYCTPGVGDLLKALSELAPSFGLGGPGPFRGPNVPYYMPGNRRKHLTSCS